MSGRTTPPARAQRPSRAGSADSSTADVVEVGRLTLEADKIPLGRERDRIFVAALLGAIARTGRVDDAVLLEAAQQAYSPGRRLPTKEKRQAALVQKAREKLELSSVSAAIAEYYGVTAGFTLKDAVEMHVAHIKGELTEKKAIVVHDGKDLSHVEIVDVPIRANYQALKDFIELTLPKQPKQVQVDQRTLVAKIAFNASEQPVIDARRIGGAK